MIVPVSEVRTYLENIDDSEYDLISSTHNEVEKFVSEYCNRTFESTSYSKERYDGGGKCYINLYNYPVTAVDRVATNIIDVIKIANTNLSTTASVSVTATGLRLVYNGTANSTILFATYTTMQAVVNAINAVGSGWAAELLSTQYATFKSTELIQSYGLSAINTNWVYLKMPDEAADSFEVDLNRGSIFRSWGWPSGYKNVLVDYTAGYSSSNMPKDLKLAIKILIKFFVNKKDDDSFGVAEYRAHNIWATFDKDETIPKEAQRILFRYKRRNV